MDVTIDNFHEIRKLIEQKKLIERCSYIGFDLQFTGVRFENNERERMETFLNEKYQKMAAVATKYNIIQCGITFVVEEKSQSIAYPFNFYVFPRQSNNSDPTISLQAGCVKFNTNQGMNWNQWIKKGINYVKISDIYKALHPEKTRSFNQIFQSMDPEAKQLISPILSIIDQLPQEQMKFNVPKYASYILKKGINQYIVEKQLSLDLISFQDELNEILIVKKITSDQVLEKNQRKQEQIAGFTLLFEKIWTSKKTFVGHNCLYDLLFIYASFVEKLPTDYDNFKKIISEDRYFYDTKYIASHFEKEKKIFPRGSSLQQIQKFFIKEAMDDQPIKLAPGFQKYHQPSLHQAGFDSYITLWVFFQFKNIMKEIQPFQAKLNINKSFFSIDLRRSEDVICHDMMIFVVPVASYLAYVPLQELRKSKYLEHKKIRQWLKEEAAGHNFILVEGLKEIFIYSKTRQCNEQLVKKMNQMKQKKVVTNIKSFLSFIKSRSQSKQ